MPSFIEFDKQATFPSSSNIGKTVFGINAAGQPVTIDSFGNVTPISQGTSVTPSPEDFDFVYNYNSWINGALDKWTKLSDGKQPETDYVQLTLIGGYVDGVNISSMPSQSVYVPHLGVTYRNDYDGVVPVNYIDFINGVFENYSLYTRITGSATQQYGNQFYANYCRTDNFAFYFKEEGQLEGNALNALYFMLRTHGMFLVQNFTNTLTLSSFDPTGGFALAWTKVPS